MNTTDKSCMPGRQCERRALDLGVCGAGVCNPPVTVESGPLEDCYGAISGDVNGCQNAARMGEHACKNRSQCWEPCGELGQSAEHVRVGREPLVKLPDGVPASDEAQRRTQRIEQRLEWLIHGQPIDVFEFAADVRATLGVLEVDLPGFDPRIRDALLHAETWIGSAPHGDNCYVSDHYEGDPGNRCNCGKESALSSIEQALECLASTYGVGGTDGS